MLSVLNFGLDDLESIEVRRIEDDMVTFFE
jgi:hypothetical protein